MTKLFLCALIYFLLNRNIILLVFKQHRQFVLLTLYSSIKYQYPPQGRLAEIPSRRGGSQKPKFLEESMKLNLNFQEVGV